MKHEIGGDIDNWYQDYYQPLKGYYNDEPDLFGILNAHFILTP